MNESDFDCLCSFARRGDQAAFETLVRRHLDLVYATALRKLADAGGAEEVCQNVFAALARKAWQFGPDDSLPAWLHRSTLLEAKSWLRAELRRRRREQAAAEMGTTMRTSDEHSALRALLPLLDEALLSLRQKDRAVLLLRYYENRSLREVGQSVGVGEDAAQKRVAAALEKLADFFQRRGFKTATVAAAAGALQHTAAGAPEFVILTVLQKALPLGGPALFGYQVWLGWLIGLTKLQKAALVLALLSLPVAWHAYTSPQAAPIVNNVQPPAPASASPSQEVSIAANEVPAAPVPALTQTVAPMPAAQTSAARQTVRPEREYSVDLRGLLSLPQMKAALVAVHHRSLDRADAAPFVAKRLLSEGEVFEDHSVRAEYVRLELLQVDIKRGAADLRQNGSRVRLSCDKPAAALHVPGGPLSVLVPEESLPDFLEFYAVLLGRTVLSPPGLKVAPFGLAAAAPTQEQAIDFFQRQLESHGLATVLEGEHLALVLPLDMATAQAKQLVGLRQGWPDLRQPDAPVPRGAVYLENVPVEQMLPIYGDLVGRRWIKSDLRSVQPFTFRTQAGLAKAEVVEAFDILLAWQQLKALPVGEHQFKLVRLTN